MPKQVDWDKVKQDYEDGGLSIEVIACKYDISSNGIRKRAKDRGWVKPDVEEQESENDVQEDYFPPPSLEELTIEAALHKQRLIVARLLDELDHTTCQLGQMKAWITDETSRDKEMNRRKAMFRAVSMGNRAIMLRNLTLATKTMIEMEHLASTIAQPKGKKAAAEQAAREINERMFGVPDDMPTKIAA